MKKKILYFLLVVFLSAFQCEDDEYVPDNEIKNDDLIEIEDNRSSFLVEDYLFITTKVNNQQTTIDNKIVNLKDFIVDDEAFIVHGLALFMLSQENQEIPYIIEEVQELDGSVEFTGQDSFFYTKSFYNEADNDFFSKIGIKLSQPGTYLLKSSLFRDNEYQIIFDLNGSASAGTLQLTTSILNADEEGVYQFTVE